MKWIIAILALISVVHGSSENGLRVKFGFSGEIGTERFIALPRLVSEAVSEGWTQMTPPDGPLCELDMYCSNDRKICTRYDPLTGFICGLQIGYPKTDISESAYGWDTQGFKSWTAKVNETDTDFWTISQYYVTKETLQKSEAERMAARDANITLQENAVWVTDSDGELVEIPTDVTDILNDNFTTQGCIPMMGQHYYQNLYTTTLCSAKSLFSWFLLTDNGKLIGTAVLRLSTVVENGGGNWYEHGNRLIAKYSVPNGPECMYDLVDSFGLTTMHIYFKDNPWDVACEEQ